MAKISTGAIAFSRRGNPATGEFEAAELLGRFGNLPAEDALLGYQ